MVEHTMVFLAIALSIVTLIVMHERRQHRGLLSLLNLTTPQSLHQVE